MIIKGEKTIIVVALIFAIFNDILRIPGTEISFFRIMIPLVALVVLANHRICAKHIMGIVFMLVVSIIQHMYCEHAYALEFSANTVVKYWLLYSSIVLIMASIHILNKKYKDDLLQLINWIFPTIGYASIILYFVKYKTNISIIANINNWACCLDLFFAYFLIRFIKGNKTNLVWCVVIIGELILGDSKAALAGVAIQMVIIVVLVFRNKIMYGWMWMPMVFIIALCILIKIASSSIIVNGYNIGEMFHTMIDNVKNQRIQYGIVNSLNYRVNSIIILLYILGHSYWIGVGPGNSARILASYMTEEALYKSTNALAPHIAVLEYMADSGIWAIIIVLCLLIWAIRRSLSREKLYEFDIYSISIVFSFFMWHMSASGLYTTYLIFIIIGFVISCNKHSFKEKIWKRERYVKHE